MAGNLGFELYLIEDCCFTFARHDYDGRPHSVNEVHARSLANLDGEYCRVVRKDEILGVLREKGFLG